MSFENMMNSFKNNFWLFSDFDWFSPVQWMTLKQQWACSAFKLYLPKPPRAECFIKCLTENYALRPTFLHKVSSQSGSKWREGVDGVAF